jgi:hypothetical protein
MKREKLMKVFPFLGERELKKLPQDLVVCWYPSSGAGTNHKIISSDSGSGYNAVIHWQEQPSTFKPNLLIFSDIEEFKIPVQADVLFTMLISEDSNFDHSISEDVLLVQEDNRGSIMSITIIKHLETFFILVQSTNEYLYNQFVNQGIEIPLLTLNRPTDIFIHNNSIDIQRLGIQEFIAGHSYVSCLTYGKEFKKHPDFVFQIYRTELVEYIDDANLYSRVNINI